MNRSFEARLPECKYAYIEAYSPSALRSVHKLIQEMMDSPYTKAARRHYFSKLMRPEAAMYA